MITHAYLQSYAFVWSQITLLTIVMYKTTLQHLRTGVAKLLLNLIILRYTPNLIAASSCLVNKSNYVPHLIIAKTKPIRYSQCAFSANKCADVVKTSSRNQD